MAQNFKWYGDRIKAQIAAEMGNRLVEASVAVQSHAKQLVNTPGTGRKPSKGKRQGALIYNTNPSAPGEPPHKQTGRLKGSIVWEIISRRLARIGTNLKYGKALETGTRRMAARPWLRRALAERRAQVAKILTRPMKLRGG